MVRFELTTLREPACEESSELWKRRGQLQCGRPSRQPCALVDAHGQQHVPCTCAREAPQVEARVEVQNAGAAVSSDASQPLTTSPLRRREKRSKKRCEVDSTPLLSVKSTNVNFIRAITRPMGRENNSVRVQADCQRRPHRLAWAASPRWGRLRRGLEYRRGIPDGQYV